MVDSEFIGTYPRLIINYIKSMAQTNMFAVRILLI